MKPHPDKAAVQYPCQWLYKVIGRDADAVTIAVREIFPAAASVSFSQTSARGTYVSLNVEISVNAQAERDAFYERLRQHPAVVTVL